MRSRSGLRSDVLWGEVGRDLLELQRTLAELIAGLDALPKRDDIQDTLLGELTAQGVAWEETRLHFARIIAEADAGTIAWLTLGQHEELGVSSAPLDVGPTIREQLIGPLAAAILTSATLTSEGSFRYVKDRLDLHDADELTVGSPFNYATSTLIYLPANAPEPNQPGYQTGRRADHPGRGDRAEGPDDGAVHVAQPASGDVSAPARPAGRPQDHPAGAAGGR